VRVCERVCVSVVFLCKRKTKRKAETTAAAATTKTKRAVCARSAASGKMPATANSWVLLLLLLVAVERCSSSNSSGRINSRSSSSGYRKMQWQEQQESPTLRPLPEKGTCAISLRPVGISESLLALGPSCLSLPRILIVVNLRCINLSYVNMSPTLSLSLSLSAPPPPPAVPKITTALRLQPLCLSVFCCLCVCVSPQPPPPASHRSLCYANSLVSSLAKMPQNKWKIETKTSVCARIFLSLVFCGLAWNFHATRIE